MQLRLLFAWFYAGFDKLAFFRFGILIRESVIKKRPRFEAEREPGPVARLVQAAD